MANLGTVTNINLGGSGNISAGQIGITDGVTKFRLIVRNQALDTDMALTPLGFAGVEDTDWMTIR